MAIATLAALVDTLRSLPLLGPAQQLELDQSLQDRFPDPRQLADELVRRGWLTAYQADELLKGQGQDLVLGAYVFLELLGEGAMGRVFKARQRSLGRVVAVKLIRPERPRIVSAMATRRAPGMLCAVRMPPLMSINVSASPCITRAGTRTDWRARVRLPDAVTAINCRATPRGQKQRS